MKQFLVDKMKFKKYLIEESNWKIYVDLDGVLVDFVNGVNKTFNINMKTHLQWDDFKKERWDEITAMGSKFWSNLPWMQDGKMLWDYVKKYDPIILSAYPQNPQGKEHAIIGKKDWLSNHINNNVAKKALIVKGVDKQKYADKNNILIDDRKRNIQQWESAGGIGILHKNTKNTINNLKEILS